MKKYTIIILSLFTIILSKSSCKKATKPSGSNDSDLPSFVQKARMLARAAGVSDTSVFNNYVAIVSIQTANSINRDSSYQTSAYAKVSQNGVPVNAGHLVLNNKTILPGADNLYVYNYSISEAKTLFGSTVQTQISDSAVTSTVTSTAEARLQRVIMTVPKEIFPSSIQFPKGTVDRNLNDTIKWSPDPTNQFGKVQITLSYYKGISQFNSANMPSAIANLSYVVADNGSFVIPKADLSRFPQGSYIGISIARTWLDNTSGRIAYISIVEAHTVPLLIIDTDPTFGIVGLSVGVSSSPTCNLSATSTIKGGKPPFTYKWTIMPGGSTTALIFNTANIYQTPIPSCAGGKYDFKVTDAMGRVATITGGIYRPARQ